MYRPGELVTIKVLKSVPRVGVNATVNPKPYLIVPSCPSKKNTTPRCSKRRELQDIRVSPKT